MSTLNAPIRRVVDDAVFRTSEKPTRPFGDQKPGTSGLRKKTKVFESDEAYLANFVQSTFDALLDPRNATNGVPFSVTEGSLLIGGDGRYYNDKAIQTIVKIAVGNGVKHILIGENGLLSTPAVSAIIREHFPSHERPFGAFILTASHNPGGPDEDFGIKYNCETGGPAPEKLTEAIFEKSKSIARVKSNDNFPEVEVRSVDSTEYRSSDGKQCIIIKVISSTAIHSALLKSVFDFSAIEKLRARGDFSFVYDCMHGVQGPYAHAVFVEALGFPASCLINAVPSPTFNGHHADPNLTYARDLCDIMHIDSVGRPVNSERPASIPCFGAACDGDADRNMILGRQFFVTPSDSLAVIADHTDCIPFFYRQGGLKSIARSMPTSGAADLVARKKGLHLFETPTGWKFFGNVMDSKLIATLSGGSRAYTNYNPMICGEESFGTGSNHVREKDGLWAVLAWLSILAHYNCDATQPFVHIEDILKRHWATYGRNYYCRYDYEGVPVAMKDAVMTHIRQQLSSLPGKTLKEGYTVASADEFTYVDPIDGSISRNQGLRIIFDTGSRIVFRESGTAGSGATIRVYLEQYEGPSGRLNELTSAVLQDVIGLALELSQIPALTGMQSPTVIT